MKNTLTRTFVSTAVAAMMVSPLALAETKFETEAQKESYAVGASMGKYMAGQLVTQQELGVSFDLEMVLAGMSDAMRGETTLDADTLVGLLNSRAEVLNERVELKKAQLAKENLAKGEAFMAENAKKEGVVTTESGLQYEVLVAGEGEKPNPEDAVTVHFKGMTIEGDVFADTTQMNQPAKVALINVIDGWNEGIQLMPVGSSYRFTIPAEMAYGAEGKDLVTPNSTLVFEIDLVKTEAPGAGGHGGMGGMGGMGMNMGMSAH